MACYKPIPAYNDGRGSVTLNPALGTSNCALPCGKCLGCRTARATEWARRCEHEAKQYRWNTFLTLTYADDKLPAEGLRPYDLTNFIKRLRKRALNRNNDAIMRDDRLPIRYLACGEYGETTGRPHYHALLFNAGFRDRKQVAKDLYESDILRELWPFGQHKLGDATPAAANYIAQYALKKQAQHLISEWRRAYICDIKTRDHITRDGEILTPPPFQHMSLKPAIGATWAATYYKDMAHGFLVTKGVKHAIPRHYKTILKRRDEPLYDEVRAITDKLLRDNPTDKNQPERLAAAEMIHHQRKLNSERKKL